MNKKLLEYFNGDEFISNVWKSKYAATGEETPDDMHLRMAKEFARIRFKKDKSKTKIEWEEYFFNIFKNFDKNIPQGRIMAGLGKFDTFRSLSNCLRLPPPQDSYSSIMMSDTMLVNAAKRGCGYGLGLSNLRPRGMSTKNASKTSTGVIGFGERYSNSTKEVGQEGRRGACLLDLAISHPDAPYWATVKLDKTKYTGANISFKIYDDFFETLLKKEDYILSFPENIDYKHINLADIKYNELCLINNEKGEEIGCIKKIKSTELWESIIHTVWSDGCPGLQFWNQIIDYDPCSVYIEYQIDGTNACGEQPMCVLDTCRLLTQLLLRCVDNPYTERAIINFDRLYEYSYLQLEIGEDLIDLEIEYIERIINKIKSDSEPLEVKTIELNLWQGALEIAKNGRRIGCGITGLADMLAALGLKYDSEEALKIVSEVMKIKMKAELNASIDLAIKYGPFKGWNAKLENKGNSWYEMVEQEFPSEWKRMQKYGRRHINFSTIAPVGTTSIITKGLYFSNVSSGCEPQFGLWYFRNKKAEGENEPFDFVDEVGIKWKQYPVLMGGFKDFIKIKYNREDFNNITQEELETYYKESPWFGCLSDQIDWKKRVEMQSILQKYTTSAISSTINLPSNIDKSVISDIYLYAWKKGLKGITCYRDGSKGGVLVKEIYQDKFDYVDAIKRPKSLPVEIHTTVNQNNKWNVIVGLLNNKPYEVFALPFFTNETSLILKKINKGRYDLIKNGEVYSENITSEMNHDQEVITRLISTSLRHGTDIKFIVEQLNKSHGDITSFNKAIARTLKKYIPEGEKSTLLCKECNSKEVVFEEGCTKCKNCGASACG